MSVPGWKRPVAAHAEECYWIDGHGDRQRSIHWYVDGFVGETTIEAQNEIRRQYAAGERCSSCQTGYPAAVTPRNLNLILREMSFGDLHGQAVTWIAKGQCGVCGAEMSHDYFAANHVQSDAEVYGP